jgi:hypothetical protein
MDAIFFILKCAALTALIVFSLNFKVGETTIEERLSRYASSTGILTQAQIMSEGALKFLKEHLGTESTAQKSARESVKNIKDTIYESTSER